MSRVRRPSRAASPPVHGSRCLDSACLLQTLPPVTIPACGHSSLGLALGAVAPRRRLARPAGSKTIRRSQVALHRTVSCRTSVGGWRRRRQSGHLLHGHAGRRRVEDDGRRDDLEADIRRRAGRLHRCARRRAVESRRRLHRNGRRQRSRRIGERRIWRLQIDRRRAQRGRTPASTTRGTSERSGSIRAIRMSSSSQRWAIRSRKMRTAGIFKTTDGGASWKKTLFKDEETGAIDVAFDAANPKIGFATVWGHYVAPGATGAVLNGTNRGAVYRTTDEGDTWTAIDGRGLPVDRVGRSRRRGRERWTARLRDHDRSAWQRPVSIRRWRRELAEGDGRFTHRRQRILQQGLRRSEERRCRLRNADLDVSLGRRRQDVHRVEGRAGRRRQSRAVDRSDALRLDGDGQRPGRSHVARRRPDVELLVQPAHWPALPPLDRQPLAVLDLRHAAGQRIDRHAQSRRLRERRHPRLGCRRRLRVRLHHPRPDQPEHHLRWRRSSRRVAARSREPAGSHRVAEHRPARRLSHGAQPAARVLATRPARAVRGHAVRARHPQWRQVVAARQPRPDGASRPRRPSPRRRQRPRRRAHRQRRTARRSTLSPCPRRKKG